MSRIELNSTTGAGMSWRFIDVDIVQESLNNLQKIIGKINEEHGFHEKKREFPEICALIHSEVSEALDEDRSGEPLGEIYYRLPDGQTTTERYRMEADGQLAPNKVEGAAAEFADIIIRVLDAAYEKRMPVVRALFEKLEYNDSRPYKHGRNY